MTEFYAVLVIALCAVYVHNVSAFIEVNSCAGRCNHHLSNGASCQCNHACTRYHDCCADYQSLCRHHGSGTVHHGTHVAGCGTSMEIADIMWKVDPDNLPISDFTFDIGNHASHGHSSDASPNKLFTTVNTAPLSRPMWTAYTAMWDNYTPTRGVDDPVTAADKAEINTFLDIVIASPVMVKALEYLTCNHIFSGDMTAFRAKLYSLWFVPYSRSGGNAKDSSGFEHVFIGEYKHSIVEGFHNWYRFYSEEKKGNINYIGYLKTVPLPMVENSFNWNGHHKAIDSFIVGTSPAFDMALATICILTKPSSVCHYSLTGHPFAIKQYDEAHTPGVQVATAYTVF